MAADTENPARLIPGGFKVIDANGQSLAYDRLARIEQAQGRVTLAREHYQQFLRRYDRPVPNLRPLVEQARSALATIEATKRGP